MREINDEIKLTLNLIQTVDNECAYSAMQYHLKVLLEIKRNELQKRLTGGSLAETALSDTAKPLTTAELLEGGWWCADTSEDALKAFILLGLRDQEYEPWGGSYYACFLYQYGSNLLDRGYECHTTQLKQIKRIGNEFYWSEK